MDDRQQSEFNMAVSYLNRLNALFFMADEAAIQLDAYTWFHTLMALSRELSTEMSPDEFETVTKFMGDINPNIQKAYANHAKTGRWQIDSVLYHEMHDFELLIRKVLKKSGMLMRMQEDPSFALQ